MDIKDLYRQGVSVREIARRTGHSRNTIIKLIGQNAPQPFQAQPRRSILDPYKPYLQERYRAYGLSSVRLLAEIAAQGYTGSLDVVHATSKSSSRSRSFLPKPPCALRRLPASRHKLTGPCRRRRRRQNVRLRYHPLLLPQALRHFHPQHGCAHPHSRSPGSLPGL